METGSHGTAHTTTQSSRTGETVIDQKPAVSAGILDAYFQRSRSLSTITASRVDSWPPVSASENSVPGGRVSSGKYRAAALQIRSLGRLESAVSSRGCNYCGLSPSASNCRLHSAGASRSRSTPMPRGKRRSTAALTRCGARNASEMVIFTCRTLHFWRVAICSMLMAEPHAKL